MTRKPARTVFQLAERVMKNSCTDRLNLSVNHGPRQNAAVNCRKLELTESISNAAQKAGGSF